MCARLMLPPICPAVVTLEPTFQVGETCRKLSPSFIEQSLLTFQRLNFQTFHTVNVRVIESVTDHPLTLMCRATAKES
jgi:hypothetical protein